MAEQAERRIAGKQARQGPTKDDCFVLLGDPGSRFPLLKLQTSLYHQIKFGN
jgi:hypothetical protein